MNYFEVLDDASIQKRWHLEEPLYIHGRNELDFWPLVSGDRVNARDYQDLNSPIQYEGTSLSFTLGAFLIPYVSAEISKVLRRLDGSHVQLLPCAIGGRDLGFSIVVVASKLQCLDLERSEIDYYTLEDLNEEEEEDRDPKKIGSIKSVMKPIVRADKVPKGAHIFRLTEDLNHLMVSEQMKVALEKEGVTGVVFEKV